jgi:beta-mannosidase
MDYRQRSPAVGNGSIIQHIARYFRFPCNGFESFVYVSQILQAVSIKTAAEHWRRLKPYCMGVLYWQLVLYCARYEASTTVRYSTTQHVLIDCVE